MAKKKQRPGSANPRAVKINTFCRPNLRSFATVLQQAGVPPMTQVCDIPCPEAKRDDRQFFASRPTRTHRFRAVMDAERVGFGADVTHVVTVQTAPGERLRVPLVLRDVPPGLLARLGSADEGDPTIDAVLGELCRAHWSGTDSLLKDVIARALAAFRCAGRA